MQALDLGTPSPARAATCPNVVAMAAVAEPQDKVPWVLHGCPVERLPPLSAEDIVYAAGAPAMVEKAALLAKTKGARFYADPFVEQAGDADSWLETLRSWRRRRGGGHIQANVRCVSGGPVPSRR